MLRFRSKRYIVNHTVENEARPTYEKQLPFSFPRDETGMYDLMIKMEACVTDTSYTLISSGMETKAIFTCLPRAVPMRRSMESEWPS